MDLDVGMVGPRQGRSTTCGAACLVVARMLADEDVAATMAEPGAFAAVSPSRFAAAEQATMRRTNGPFPRAGRVQAPWPRGLGTPPWGAMAELEREGLSYSLWWLRHLDAAGWGRARAALARRIAPGSPALLYVGHRWLPRHVTLVFAPRRGRRPAVYEPATGRVLALSSFDDATPPALGGWRVPWFALVPSA